MKIYSFFIFIIFALFFLLKTIVPNLEGDYFWLYEIVIFILIFTFFVKFKSKNEFISFSFFMLCVIYNIIERFLFINGNYHDLVHFILIINGLFFLLIENKNIQSTLKKFKNENRELELQNSLTKLPNRNYLMKTLAGDFGNYKEVAGLYLDIDDFNIINNIVGQEISNRLIIFVVERIKSLISKNDIIIHIDSDEFIIIIHDMVNLVSITNRILKEISKPYYIDDKKLRVTASIGISISSDHGNDLNILIKKAGLAMHEAKRLGKNQYFMFENRLEHQFDKRYLLINELKTAINNIEFLVYYQPIARTENNKITRLEALIRWEHRKHGMIYPNDFISIAEEEGLIAEIDYIVLEKVCQQLSDWAIEKKKLYSISVNISPKFFKSHDFFDKLDHLLYTYNVNTNYLSIEITETSAMKNISKTKELIKKLIERNIKVSIDDFGKGYSSLTYLKEFSFDYLKIDKAFIDRIPDNNSDAEIIKMIINLSKIFHFKIIFEGVEKKEQLEFIQNNGCHEYQGYLLSKPNSIENLILDSSNNE